MEDMYNSGTPKYSTATDIYDGLCELAMTEEASILGEMFGDVSYEGQDYYYTEKGSAFKARFERMSDYGNKMWLMDLAVFQLDGGEVNDLVYQALCEPDMGKRIGFRKLFIEIMLGGYGSAYDAIADAYLEELREMDYFDSWKMTQAFRRAMESLGRPVHDAPYTTLTYHLAEKIAALHLQKETRLIAECRALLTSYDDFILGLRMNQTLYTGLEKRYQAKEAALKAGYAEMTGRLLAAAQEQGITFALPEEAKALAGNNMSESDIGERGR